MFFGFVSGRFSLFQPADDDDTLVNKAILIRWHPDQGESVIETEIWHTITTIKRLVYLFIFFFFRKCSFLGASQMLELHALFENKWPCRSGWSNATGVFRNHINTCRRRAEAFCHPHSSKSSDTDRAIQIQIALTNSNQTLLLSI